MAFPGLGRVRRPREVEEAPRRALPVAAQSFLAPTAPITTVPATPLPAPVPVVSSAPVPVVYDDTLRLTVSQLELAVQRLRAELAAVREDLNARAATAGTTMPARVEAFEGRLTACTEAIGDFSRAIQTLETKVERSALRAQEALDRSVVLPGVARQALRATTEDGESLELPNGAALALRFPAQVEGGYTYMSTLRPYVAETGGVHMKVYRVPVLHGTIPLVDLDGLEG